MHRIDSATARADANGAGKTGFSDNGDLPNQDATYFTPSWANSLQEEVANVIEEFGIALDKDNNGQLLAALVKQFGEKKVLTDAIDDYKEMIRLDRVRLTALEERTYEDTQVGEHIWTEQHFLTPEDVTEYKGYGTWERALQGRVAVGFSDNPSDDVRFRTSNAEYGENEHTLTVDQIPKHKHSHSDKFKYFIAKHFRGESIGQGDFVQRDQEWQSHQLSSDEFAEALEESRGGDQPHNNMQQSKTLDCWLRIG